MIDSENLNLFGIGCEKWMYLAKYFPISPELIFLLQGRFQDVTVSKEVKVEWWSPLHAPSIPPLTNPSPIIKGCAYLINVNQMAVSA